MSRIVRCALVCLIVCAGQATIVLAQSTTETLSMEGLVQRIDKSADEIKLLSERLKTAPDAEKNALAFRLDQRSIRLMQAIAKLATQVAALPPDDPDGRDFILRMRADLAGMDQVIFQRIEGLHERINANDVKLEAAGEPDVYVLRAYGHSLEELQLGYYSALVSLIETRETLGGTAEALRQNTEKVLYRYAEKLAGRIELLSATLREIKTRAVAEPGNASLQSAASDIRMEQNLETVRLQGLLKLMSRLEMDTVSYRSVLLRESSGVSLRMFDSEALLAILEDGFQTTKEALVDRAPNVLLKVLVFLLVILAFRALSRVIRRMVKSALDKSRADFSTLLKDILVSISGAAVMLFGILVALAQVGISLGPALAGLGVAGFIVGFALQDTLGNFAAGGMILIYRPYDVNDFVEVAGAAGLVKKMTLVSTTITTFDNQTLVIPNSKIWGDVIKNVTAQTTRRVDMQFGISYSDDIEKAERVLKEIVASHDKVLAEPEPIIRLHSLGDSSVNFVVRPWTATSDYWLVYWDITREVKLRFDREGISIPFPQRDVHLHERTG